jgi:hypothetical protein
VQTTEPADHGEITVSTLEVGGSRGIARIVTIPKDGAPAYRQTRFYRRIGSDWRQTPPDAALWGLERSLETPFFVFHFRQLDAPAVIAVAHQIDALYMTLRHNLGLESAPGSEKLVIEVSVTQTPTDTPAWSRLPAPLTVPSPAVYRAPVELTDAELLEQSIVLPLLNYVLAQASERYQMHPEEYAFPPSMIVTINPPKENEAVMLATLIEYAAATYGRERLPVLVAGLVQYDNWETLLPAVFGVSPDEFEAGWQAYLATRYGVSLDILTQ